MIRITFFPVDFYLISFFTSIICFSAMSMDQSVKKDEPYTIGVFFRNFVSGKRECVVKNLREKVWKDLKGQWYLGGNNQPIYGIDASSTIQYTKFFQYLYDAKNNKINDTEKRAYAVIEELADYDPHLKKLISQQNSTDRLKHLENASISYNCEVLLSHVHDERLNIQEVFWRLVDDMKFKRVRLQAKGCQCSRRANNHICGYFGDRLVINNLTRELSYCQDDESYIIIAQADQKIVDPNTVVEPLHPRFDINVSASTYSPFYVLKLGSKFVKYDWINPERCASAGMLLLGLVATYCYKKSPFSKSDIK